MILELCLALAPQNFEVDDWFRLHPAVGTGGTTISADRREASAESAIRELARAMKWRIQVADAELEKLTPVSLDLAITRRDPRTVAQWIAATAGLEVTFRDDEGQVVMHLSDARHASREELRRRAILWYDEMIDGSARPAAGTARLEALMGLGDVLEDAGELSRAVTVYDRVYEEDDDRHFAARALLRASAVHLALATRTELPELKRKAHRQLAEETARRVLRSSPGEKNVAASLQLGRVLAQAGRWSDCIRALEAESGADVDLSLLLAQAFVRAGRPERAVRALDSLQRASASTWTRARFCEYHYWRGVSLELLKDDRDLRRARLDGAMRSLEIFVASSDDTDPRRARALIALGHVYSETGRHVEARAAIGRVLEKKSRLDLADLEAAVAGEKQITALTGLDAARAKPAARETSIQALFHDRRFADIVRLAGAIEEDDDAPLTDMFHVGRAHEELHRRGKPGTDEANRAATRHFERACEIYARIERRDVRHDREGKPTPGPWAAAARSAREVMQWLATRKAWTTPRIDWTIDQASHGGVDAESTSDVTPRR
jgi:tetratricopeptide (TPR) repeat protein